MAYVLDEDEDDEYGDVSCQCTDGYILICPDDMCRAVGECRHRDGYQACPVCYP